MDDLVYAEIAQRLPEPGVLADFVPLCDGSVPLPDGMVAGIILMYDDYTDVMYTLDGLCDHVAECRAAGIQSQLDACDHCTLGIVWHGCSFACVGTAE